MALTTRGPRARLAARTTRIEMEFTLNTMKKDWSAVEKSCASLLVLVVGCGGGATNWTPGQSDGRGIDSASAPVTSASAAGRPSAGVWEHWKEVEKFRVMVPSGPSRGHHVGGLTGEIRANEQGASSMGDSRTVMGKGAVVVEVHRSRASGAAAGAFAMEKKEAGYNPEGGDWEYVVMDGEGRVQNRGKLGGCARCHAEAATDFVFGGPNKR